MTIINVYNLFATIVGPLIGIINILILINSDIISVTTIDKSIRFGFALCRPDLVQFYINNNS